MSTSGRRQYDLKCLDTNQVLRLRLEDIWQRSCEQENVFLMETDSKFEKVLETGKCISACNYAQGEMPEFTSRYVMEVTVEALRESLGKALVAEEEADALASTSQTKSKKKKKKKAKAAGEVGVPEKPAGLEKAEEVEEVEQKQETSGQGTSGQGRDVQQKAEEVEEVEQKQDTSGQGTSGQGRDVEEEEGRSGEDSGEWGLAIKGGKSGKSVDLWTLYNSINSMRIELRTDIASVRSDIASVRRDVKSIQKELSYRYEGDMCIRRLTEKSAKPMYVQFGKEISGS